MAAPDFILAGNASVVDRWPQAAREAGILWCGKKCPDVHQCPSSIYCNGCGITDGSYVQKVMMIAGVSGCDFAGYERLLLLTPSKKNLDADISHLRALVSMLLAALGVTHLHVFESHSTDAGVEWVLWCGPKDPGTTSSQHPLN